MKDRRLSVFERIEAQNNVLWTFLTDPDPEWRRAAGEWLFGSTDQECAGDKPEESEE